MTKKLFCFLISVFIVLAFVPTSHAQKQNEPPKVGSKFPETEFAKLVDAKGLGYLGLSSGGNTFKVEQIKTQVVIIEIFSMYCPYCQKEAPNVNKLFQQIESDPTLKEKIKIIGLGAGNSLFETNIFKKKYNIDFPLIPDENFKLHKILGETRTPFFIVVKLNGSNRPDVIYSRLGALENVESFLAQIVQQSGLK